MRILNFIDRIFLGIAMVSLFSIMLIVALDGLLRQFFNLPIAGAYIITENYLMVAMILPMIGFTWAKQGHIGITLVYDRLPIIIQNLIYFIILVIGFLILMLVVWTGFERTLEAFIGNQVTSGLIRWPLWLAYVWMPIGGFLFCLRMVLELVFGIITVFKQNIFKVKIKDMQYQKMGE